MLKTNKNLIDVVRDCLQLCILEIDGGGETSWQHDSVTKLLGFKWHRLNDAEREIVRKVFDEVVKLYRK